MDLQTYIETPARLSQLAADVGTSPGWIWQIATGWRGKRASAEMAVKIETATAGEVSRAELRPDLFASVVTGAAESAPVKGAA